MTSWEVYDTTRGHVVNEQEANCVPGEYGEVDAPSWYGSHPEAEDLAEELAKITGHDFIVRRR